MVQTEEVALTLQNILNGVDTNISSSYVPKYQFLVVYDGYYVDKLYDMSTGNNFIFVYIDKNDGTITPIPDLKGVYMDYSVCFFFPVSIKQDICDVMDYLISILPGEVINYGTNSGYCLTNITPGDFGGFERITFQLFQNIVNKIYRKPVEFTQETFMTLNFALYLASANNINVYDEDNPGYVFGNSVQITLTYNNYSDDSPTFINSSIAQSSSEVAQQILGGVKETSGMATTTTLSTGLQVYVKNSNFYRQLLGDMFQSNIQNQTIQVTISIPPMNLTYTRNMYLSRSGLTIQRGSLLILTFTYERSA